MEPRPSAVSRTSPIAITCLVLALLSAAGGMIFWYAPTEATMGDVQRILYLHVAVAWSGLLGSVGMGACGLAYLLSRDLRWDHWARAAGEVSWLCVSMTLLTGSMWAQVAWGVWWTWEPRLTSALLLWLILAGIFLVRSGLDDPHHQARIGGVLALLAVADIPLIVMATRWFRGVHPVAPRMDERMHLTLLVTAVSFTIFFAWCVVQRRRQLALAERAATLDARLAAHGLTEE
jgi:heme exporter protein C